MWFCCGLGGFFGEKCWLNTQNLYFNDFCPKMWTFTTLPWSWFVKKSLCFAFTIVLCILCCLKMIFWWFGRIYWGEILIKYQNNSIFTILAPKWWPSTALPWSWTPKNHYFFYFSNSSLHILLPKGHFLVVWEDLLGGNID